MYRLYAVAREKIGVTNTKEIHNIKKKKIRRSKKKGFLILFRIVFINNPFESYNKMLGMHTEDGNVLLDKALIRD